MWRKAWLFTPTITITIMPETFIIYALLAGIGVALMCGMLGCFVAWQRMAYFGDTIAHSALLGVVLGLVLDIGTQTGIIAMAILIAFSMTYLECQKQLATDTLLGIIAHGALAVGLIILSLSDVAVDITGYLFGDVLVVDTSDILRIYASAAVVGAVMYRYWRDLLRMTLHADIAAVEGVNVRRMRMILMLTIALAIAVSIKVVGFLLITSLLIIPAAAARCFAKTPTQMMALSCAAGVMAVIGGISASLHLDTPSGASIIVVALLLFIVAHLRQSIVSK